MGATLSVRPRSAYSNLENFHGASISTNDFPPYIGDAFIPFSFLSANSPQNRCQVKHFRNGRITKPPRSFNSSPLDVNLATVLLALLVSPVVPNRRNSSPTRRQLRIRRL